jgi:hypothetical protein
MSRYGVVLNKKANGTTTIDLYAGTKIYELSKGKR